MYLFTSKNSSFDDLVEKATSESLPMGSENLATYFEICDLIRGKSVAAKDAMRSLKKRIIHKASNVQFLALKLTDTCVKNGGHHFLVEIASCEFMDSLVSQLRIQTLSQPVRVLILQFIQSWAFAFQGKSDLEYVYSIYTSLKAEGCWNFPPPPAEDKLGGKAIMIDTVTIPDWTDSSDCERCRTSFTFINRKHHCRACGRTVCQDCSSKSIPLPQFGVKEEVRVCDGCFATKGRPTKHPAAPLATAPPTSADMDAKEQEEIDLAIALSLADKKQKTSAPSTAPSLFPSKHPEIASPASPEDPDLLRAIAASLADMRVKSNSAQQQISSLSASNPTISAPQTLPAAPPVSFSNQLSDIELDNIQLFSQMIQKIEAQGQAHAILQSREIAGLNQSMAALQPKLATWLHETLATHHALSEMNMRLSEAVHLYESMLQQRIMHPTLYHGSLQPGPLHVASSATAVSYMNDYGSSLPPGAPPPSQVSSLPPANHPLSVSSSGAPLPPPPHLAYHSFPPSYPPSYIPAPLSSHAPGHSIATPSPPSYNLPQSSTISAPPLDPSNYRRPPPLPLPPPSQTSAVGPPPTSSPSYYPPLPHTSQYVPPQPSSQTSYAGQSRPHLGSPPLEQLSYPPQYPPGSQPPPSAAFTASYSYAPTHAPSQSPALSPPSSLSSSERPPRTAEAPVQEVTPLIQF